MTSNDILKLLLKKHHNEICVPECKSGSIWLKKDIKIMDLWVMYKSWVRPRTIGYEIKVSRSDFLNDNKWKDYLGYCSEFYFVAPPGIIDPKELPPEAGLLATSINCKKLCIKKESPVRDISIPVDLYKYILISRTKIIECRTQYSWNYK